MRSVFFVNPNGVPPRTAHRIGEVEDERVGCGTVTYPYLAVILNGLRSFIRDRQFGQHLDFAFPFIRGGIESIRTVNDIVYRAVGRFAGNGSNENADANQREGYTF